MKAELEEINRVNLEILAKINNSEFDITEEDINKLHLKYLETLKILERFKEMYNPGTVKYFKV